MKISNITEFQKKREALISDFLNDGASNFTEMHSRLFDDYFCKGYENYALSPGMGISKTPYAIVALGGYGRKEQCIHSDVDLLFLFDKSVPGMAEELVKEIVYPLWDIGLEVGHATRSIKECINLAEDDLTVLISLLDSRFVCGISDLYIKMYEKLHQKIIHSRLKKIVSMLVKDNRSRHLRFGDSSYLLEPNLKEGQGGLRDFHMMLWIAGIMSGLKQTRDLEYSGYLSEKEFETMIESVLFIHNVRNRLHYIAGRKNDQLHMEYQIKLADLMQFQKKNGQEPVEIFLGELHGHMEQIKQQHLIFLSELDHLKPRTAGNFFLKKSILKNKTKIPGLKVNQRNMLEFISMETVIKSPELLLKIFVESADKKIPLSAMAKRIIKELLYLVDEGFRKNKSIVKNFEYILASVPITFNILNEMLNTGFLVHFIPEFKGVVNRIQYNEYHIFPVDKHSVKTVQMVKSFNSDGNSDQLTASLYDDLSDKKVLLWACLLHDIGKSKLNDRHAEAGAAIAAEALKRYGMETGQIKAVSFLIREHLFLIKTATRRNIKDEEIAVFCARKIKDVERLKMLYLLTVADSMSTGPKAWNDWTATLLFELFTKILTIFEKGELATTEAVETVEHKKKKLHGILTEKDMLEMAETFLGSISLRYLLYVPASDMPEHINLYHKLKDSKNSNFVWKIKKADSSNTRIVTICAKNRPGLFSKIAGVLTLSGLDILNAQIFTWKNNIALDIFHVNPPKDLIFEDEKWIRTAEDLQTVLNHDINLSVRVCDRLSKSEPRKIYTLKKSLEINVDDDSSDFFSIIEIFSYDFPGLLYVITDALFRCGLDIYVAKIATKVDQIVDIFYVRNFYGEKGVTREQKDKIIKKIKERLPAEYLK